VGNIFHNVPFRPYTLLRSPISSTVITLTLLIEITCQPSTLADAFVVNSGGRFDLDSNFSAGVDATDVAILTAATASSITVNLDTSNTSAGANNSGITLTEFNTVNFGNTGAAATTLDGALPLVVAGIGKEVDLNINTGTSAGITITSSTTATTGTLDTVSITGASAFVQTGVMTAANVNSTATHDVTFTAALTSDTVIG